MRLMLIALMLTAAPLAAQPMMTAAAPAASGYVADRPPLALMRLLPPPPEAGSTDEQADKFLYRHSKRGIGGPMWQSAIGQLSVTSPSFVKTVSCALGATLTPQATPATMMLLRRAGTDLGRAVFLAKDYYKRPRPFSTDRGKACDPDAAKDGGKALRSAGCGA
jgi:acid phosphatase (class A)